MLCLKIYHYICSDVFNLEWSVSQFILFTGFLRYTHIFVCTYMYELILYLATLLF